MSGPVSILSQRWTDILPPQPPAPIGWWLLLSGVILLLLVVLVVAVLWQQRPRPRALRVLRQCRRALATGTADTRRIAHRIYQAMLQGLAIHPAKVTTVTCDRRWQEFSRRLQACVFAPHAPGHAEVAELIREGRFWLRQSGRP